MALTVTVVSKNVIGSKRNHIVDVLWDGAYADDGESLTPDMCGLTHIDFVSSGYALDTGADAAYLAVYNYTTQKLVLINSGTADAVLNEAGADDLSTGYELTRLSVIGH